MDSSWLGVKGFGEIFWIKMLFRKLLWLKGLRAAPARARKSFIINGLRLSGPLPQTCSFVKAKRCGQVIFSPCNVFGM